MQARIPDWVWKNRQWQPRRLAPGVPLGEVLEELQESRVWAAASVGESVEEVVGELLGPALAGHVTGTVVEGGRLVLRVDDPAYGFEILNFWHTPILGAVQAAVPRAGVHELRCELDAGGGSQGHARGQRGSR